MKKIIFMLLMLPSLLWAQDAAKYLAGAVPVENGTVTFRQTIQAPTLSQKDIYQSLLLWATQKYQPTEEFKTSQLIMKDEAGGELGSVGEDFITFSSSFLSLDRSRMYYQLKLHCKPGACEVEMSRIRYWYEEERDGGERYKAEELITDEYGLNKKKDKLARVIGKFREKTIDYKDNLFKEIANVLGGTAMNARPTAAATPQTAPVHTVNAAQTTAAAATHTATVANPAVAVATPVAVQTAPATPAAPQAAPAAAAKGMDGFKQIAPDQIPGNIIKMITDDKMIITAGNDELFNPMAGGWGGLGNLFNRPVAYCFIDPSRYTYGIMQKNDTYTLTFYTPAYQNAIQYCGTHSGRDADKVAGSGLTPITTPSGSKAFAEAWLVIECKKIASQLITPSAITDPAVKAQYPHKRTELFVGEIIGVWTK